MNNEIEERIKRIEENFKIQFEQVGKRIEDAFKYPTFIVGALTVVLLLLGLYSAFSVKSEIDRLNRLEEKISRDYEKESQSFQKSYKDLEERVSKQLSEILAQASKKPEIVLLADAGKQLEGQVIPAIFTESKKGEYKLQFKITIRNSGTKPTDPLYISFYYKKPIIPKSEGVPPDETDFDYHTTVFPEKLPASGILPAGYPARLTSTLELRQSIKNPNLQEYPVLIKVYYGLKEPAQANFKLKIK